MINPNGTSLATEGTEAALDQIALARSEVLGTAPQFLAGIIRLSQPAPAGGTEVELFSDQPAVLSLPTSITVPAGETTAAFDAGVTQVTDRVVALVTAKQGDKSRWTTLMIRPPGEAGDVTSISANGTAAAPVSDTSRTAFAAAAASAAQMLDPAWVPKCEQSLRAALLGVLPTIPFLAVLAMLAIYATPPPMQLSVFDPFLAGTTFAIVVGLVGAFLRWRVVHDTSAERANATSFDEIRERLGAITARFSTAATRIDDDEARQMALREVQAWRAQAVVELSTSGPGWVLGSAYMNVWKLVHRAEEALLELIPTPQVVAEALYDEQRLSGAEVDNRDGLITRLRLAVSRLDSNSMAYLNQQPVAPVVGAASDAVVPQTARAVLREIRRTINEFRDESWCGLVRARNHLMRTLTLTGLVTYFGLVLALDLSGNKPAGFDPRSDPIIAAAAFYLVGALVGLFNRLSSELNGNSDVEDYGLTEARLSLTPVLSGLAAIGGVYLTAMLTGTLNGVVSGSVQSASLALPNAGAILNLSQNPFGLVLAAVFGLSPTVLISALQAQADKYKGALQSTASHN